MKILPSHDERPARGGEDDGCLVEALHFDDPRHMKPRTAVQLQLVRRLQRVFRFHSAPSFACRMVQYTAGESAI